MTFLPVVERELRVAARQRSTFWLRVVAALVAVLIGGCVILTYNLAFNKTMFNIGGMLFQTLTWMAVFSAYSCGLFFTADCISAEKREGTLGFLFLTDLRGYDVVSGKLFANSLRSVYGLLAIFPVLAMIMLMGGVSGTQFWKTNLALLNALICSLNIGVFVSARSRDGQKALLATLVILILFAGVGPLISGNTFDTMPASPIYTLYSASSIGTHFWTSLLICQSIAWTLFAWACVTLPRRWQKDERARTAETTGWKHFWKYGSKRRQLRLRRRWLDRNPITWLVSRQRWQALWLWLAVVIAVVVMTRTLLNITNAGTSGFLLTMIWGWLQSLLSMFIYLWAASQATRFFGDAKQSGFLELLLASPVSVRTIVHGHWLGFIRTFALPILVLQALHVAVSPAFHRASYASVATTTTTSTTTVTSPSGTKKTMTITNVSSSAVVWPPKKTGNNQTPSNAVTISASTGVPPTNSTTVTVPPMVIPQVPVMYTIASTIAGAVAFILNLLAISWFGPWMSLTTKGNNLAILKTIVFVQLIPWFITNVFSGIVTMAYIMPMAMKGKAAVNSFLWVPLIMAAVSTTLMLAKDIFFIVWSRRKLYTCLRDQAAAIDTPRAFVPRSTPPPLPNLHPA